MSFGQAPADEYVHQQMRAEQQQRMQINASVPQPQPEAKTPHTGPKHAANLDKVTGIQTRRFIIGINGSAASFQAGGKAATTAKLGAQFIESMKRPTTLQNRHKATGADLVGNPETVLIQSLKICSGYNGTTQDLSVDIDGIFPTSGNAAHTPCAVNLPRTGPGGKIFNDYVLNEPNNKMSDKMLKFQGLLRDTKYEIIKNPNPDAEFWNVVTRDPKTKRVTFSIALLQDMVNEGRWPQPEAVSDCIAEGLNDSSVTQLEMPRFMLEAVDSEITEGRRELASGLLNLHEWGVHFRPAKGNAWTSSSLTQGAHIGASMATIQKAEAARNAMPSEAWIEVEMTYGMLL